MTNPQVFPEELFLELHALTEECVNGTATLEQATRLDRLMIEDERARKLYVRYVHTLCGLRTWSEYPLVDSIDNTLFPVPAPSSEEIAKEDETSPSVSRVPTFFSTTFHSTIGYSSGWPVAYLIATVITGLAILGFWLMPVSRPEQLARQSDSLPSPLSPLPSVVGRITGLVDCQWNCSSRVSLGQKCRLASGLMEITYDTGAQVILQGPVTFEVESNGGYLAVGKLTGKLGERGVRERKAGTNSSPQPLAPSPSSNPQSLIPNPFVIRTPTATVTDLGTEFGVEVNEEGVAETQVFVGAVKVMPVRGQSGERIVHAGNALRFDNRGIRAIAVKPQERRFVRALPANTAATRADAYANLVLSLKPAVYYRMEEWPKAEKNGCYVLVDSAPGGHHGKLYASDERPFQSRCRGKFGNALYLHGPMVGDYAIVPDYPKPENGQLSVSVWVWVDVFTDQWSSFVSNCWATPPSRGRFFLGFDDGFRLAAVVKQQDRKDIDVNDRGGGIMLRGQWLHVAFVADGATLRLYRNGIEVGSKACQGVAAEPVPKDLGIGCLTDQVGERASSAAGPPRFWSGRLDEVAIFNHALSAEQVRQLADAHDDKPTQGLSNAKEKP